jgi:hypothetical protein
VGFGGRRPEPGWAAHPGTPGLKESGGSVSPEIVTDRPDITESGIVVPKGSLQAENGLTLTNDHDQRTVDLSETWEAGPNCAW